MSEAEPTRELPHLQAAGDEIKASERPPALDALFLAFLRLGAVSFGGPAMIAYIKRLAVARRGWLSEDEFQDGVALCQAVPGATAMQCAAYVGLRARGLGGALAAYVGFGLPAFLLMLGLAVAYRQAVQLQAVTSMLAGLRAIVVALVANSVWSFARSSLRGGRAVLLASVATVLFLLGGSPFLIVVAAALAGTLWLRRPSSDPSLPSPAAAFTWTIFRPAVLVAAFGVVLAGALAVYDRRLATLGLVMMKVDLFAFGGGFASVPLMFREVVGVRKWMSGAAFMDGIALGQVTPGPIVITATFVGHQVAGLSGAVVGTVGIFLPSLMMVVLVAPWFTRFRSAERFQAASRALVLSFVGLLVSVTIHFATLTPWSLKSAALAGLALLALLRKVDVIWVVLAGAVASALIL